MSGTDRLVQMANDIATCFQSEPDHDEAGGAGLLPLAREAVAEAGRHLGAPPTPPWPESGGDAG